MYNFLYKLFKRPIGFVLLFLILQTIVNEVIKIAPEGPVLYFSLIFTFLLIAFTCLYIFLSNALLSRSFTYYASCYLAIFITVAAEALLIPHLLSTQITIPWIIVTVLIAGAINFFIWYAIIYWLIRGGNWIASRLTKTTQEL